MFKIILNNKRIDLIIYIKYLKTHFLFIIEIEPILDYVLFKSSLETYYLIKL